MTLHKDKHLAGITSCRSLLVAAGRDHAPGSALNRPLVLASNFLIGAERIYARGDLLVEGRIEACLLTLTGKPRRIPEPVRALIMPFVDEDAV